MTWLDRTPRGVVRACLRMLPRLDAEESIVEAKRIAVGTGSLDASKSQQAMAAWIRQAGANQGQSEASSSDVKAFCRKGAMGCIKVPKPRPADTTP